DGAILGYVGAAVDITDRRNDEEELRGLSSRLIHAQESERQRIARELHDDIGQRLSLLVVNLHLLGQGQESQPAGTIPTTALHEVLEDAHELVNDVHVISHGLHSAKLRLLGLGPAMKELCGQLAKQHLCEIELLAEGDWALLPEAVSLCFYRVAQE